MGYVGEWWDVGGRNRWPVLMISRAGKEMVYLIFLRLV